MAKNKGTKKTLKEKAQEVVDKIVNSPSEAVESQVGEPKEYRDFSGSNGEIKNHSKFDKFKNKGNE